MLNPVRPALQIPDAVLKMVDATTTLKNADSSGNALKPYEKFAAMIDRHWDGIAAYCQPENKVALGFVEGLNNKIRVIQRLAYGLCDVESLRLKVLSCMLPEI